MLAAGRLFSSRSKTPVLFLATFLAILAAPARAQELSITTSVLEAPGNVVSTGANFRYRVTYSCNLVVGNCENAVVTVALPPEVEFVDNFFPPGDVASAVHSGPTPGGTVTFTFQPVVTAGNAGDLDVTVRFPLGSTTDGTMTTGTTDAVESSGDPPLVTQMADLPVVTADVTPAASIDVTLQDPFVDSCQAPGPPGAFPSTYEVRVGPASAAGSVDFADVAQVVLTLPPGVDSVNPLDGGVYNAVGNTVTWSSLGGVSVGSTLLVRVELNFPAPPFSDGDTITAMANALVDPLDGPPNDPTLVPFGPLSFMDTVTRFGETTETTVIKTFGDGRPTTLPPAEGQDFSYEVSISNTGNFDLDTLSVVDDGNGMGAVLHPGISVSSVSTGVYSPAPTSVTINVTGNMGSTPSLTSLNGTLDLTAPGMLMPGERVDRIEWVFNGGAPGGMAPTTAARVATTVNAGFAAGTTIDNHVTSTWTASPTMPGPCGGPVPPSSGGETDNFPFDVNDAYTYLAPSKNEVTTGPYFPGDPVSLSFDVTNDILANDPATDPVVVDLLPEFLSYQTGTAMVTGGMTGVVLAAPGDFEVIDNYNGTGRTLLRWNLTGDLDPGETVTISFDTTLEVGAIFGTLTNTMGMTYPAGPIRQECAGSSAVDAADLDGDASSVDLLCTADEGVEVAAVAQLPSVKLVRGQCDASFATPGPGTSVRGGIVDWGVEISNDETVPMGSFVFIDILPDVGDTGVRDLTPRLSTFRPLLFAPINPPPGGAVFYSLSGNPCRPEVGGPTSGCDVPNWTTIPPTPISDTRSIKIEFGGLVLNPLDVLEFSWSMVIPADAPTDGSQAFNSFAYGSNRQDDGGFLGAEPNKVGIDVTCMPAPPDDAMLGDFVWLDSNGDGDQDGGELGVNDVPVDLYDPGPDGLPRTGDDILVLSTVTAADAMGNPGWFKFSALAAGDYYVAFTPPQNFEVTLQDVGGDEALDSDADPTTACTDVVTLAVSEDNPDVDMGLLPPVTASLGNYVWFDRDGDGIQDEALTDGLNGVTVHLFADDGDNNPEPGGADGTPLQSTVTADDAFGNPGFYLFEDLIPGVPYFVQFVSPVVAVAFTTRNAGGDDTVDSDARSSDGTTPVVTLAPGEHDPTLDAGFVLATGTLSLGNVVWCDDDGNGVIDVATDDDGAYDPLVPEAGVNGVRLNLYVDLNTDGLIQVNEFIATTQTQTLAGQAGRYRFDDLPAGDYIVEVTSSNFDTGAALEGKVSSTGFSANPNDDVDNDDSGDTAVTAVISRRISLLEDTEPTPDANDDLEDDDNVNFTLDFGFIPGVAPGFDFGDDPDTGAGTAQGNYNTVTFDGGAFHPLPSPMGPYLGDCVDADNGLQQSFTADADDLAGATGVTHGTCATAGDDEDGVAFSTALLAIGGTFDVTLSSSSATACTTSGWIDWDQNGVFDNAPPEKILIDVATGLHAAIAVPPTALPGFTYARFRCSAAGGDGPVGPGAPGEVEDYRIEVMGADFGDAPDVYGTLMASSGAVHDTDPGIELYLGNCVDTEADGQPSFMADDDDNNLGTSRIGDCIDDEDGVTFDTMLVRGQTATITVTASMMGRLDAWIDFDRDAANGFAGPSDQVLADVALTAGAHVFMIPVPAFADPGLTYARFRFSTAGGLMPTGMAADGEVEDYAVIVKAFDYGDLPEPEYPTFLASGGPRHIIDPSSSVFLGPPVNGCVDVEDNGVPSMLANGDDTSPTLNTGADAGTCDTTDDEDGVVFDTMLVACQSAQVTITARAAGRLDAWIDFNPVASPGFDPGDQVFNNQLLSAGPNVLAVPIPCNAEVNVTSYARFRFSTAGGLGVGGLAMDGEVEDYTVFLKGSDFGDAPDSYGTTSASPAGTGARHGVDPRPGSQFVLGACADTELNGPPAGNASQDDASPATSVAGTCAVATDDEDGIAFAGAMAMAGACTNGNMLTVSLLNSAGFAMPRLDAWIDWNADGDFDHPAEHLFGGTSAALTGPSTNLSYSVPCDAVPQLVSYARFRLSSTGGLMPTGPAFDGEVEDYAFQVKGVDFGDAPDTYGTTLTAVPGDASHTIVPGYSLGSAEDTEPNGQPNATATGDDVTTNDEDGVAFAGGMAMAGACTTNNGVAVTLTNTAGVPAALLDAWIDWNGDGDFDHPAEHLFGGASQPLAPAANNLTYDVPCNAVPQATSYARFRLSSAGGLPPTDGVGTNPVPDGEVEDYTFQVKGVDFGDAPDTYGTTLAAALGDASHVIVPGYSLGTNEDTEADGQPNPGADGDDTTGAPNDEDGVAFAGGMAMAGACTNGNAFTVTLTNSASVPTAFLDAWIDFNGDGVFNHPAEHLFGGTSTALTAGANNLTYDVPCDAAEQAVSYARFRLSSTGGLLPADGPGTDPIGDGEVEDYLLQVKGTDYGDAPDTYGTTMGSALGDASHVIVPGFSLGTDEDEETDGQPTAGADGDDTTDDPDEDGVTFVGGAMVAACTPGNGLDVTLTNTAGLGTAFLDAWIDFDGNGVFDHPAEHLFGGTSAALTLGVNNLTYTARCDAVEQAVSYARFRLSSTGGLTPADGPGVDPVADGEVEDYVVEVKGADFGDAPDTYSTLISSNGPGHGVDPADDLFLGACVDTESDGQPTAGADGDDTGVGTTTDGTCVTADDDEDGVVFDTMLIACDSASITVTASAAGRLDAWIDFDGDGTFSQPADQVFADRALAGGAESLTFPVPCDAAARDTYARFRFSSTGSLTFTGPAPDGEVEDYAVAVKGSDLGDAPDTYTTLFASGGPFHGIDPALGLYLGACVDADADGQPSVTAADDDTLIGLSVEGTCAGNDDEDGVVFDTQVKACQNAQVTVTASVAGGVLNAFVDFDADGTFDLPRDQVFTDEPLAAGPNVLTFFTPCDAADANTYSRFRLDTAGSLSFGGAAMNGEVEDYLVLIEDSDFGDAPDSYGTTFAAGGPIHGLDAMTGLYLGACVDAEADGQPTVGADGDDLGAAISDLGSCTGTDDEDGVVFDTPIVGCQAAQVTVTASVGGGFLDAWIDYDGNGDFNAASDQVFASQPLTAGANVLPFSVPCAVLPGSTYARFRVSTAGGLASGGATVDGEVEDYAVTLQGSDLGDAPDTYATTFGAGGPFHGVDPALDLYLGACVDTDADGQPSVDADGDNLGAGTGVDGTCGASGDEDGVAFDTMINVCFSADITVTASASGFLDAWIDLDGDGTFNGPNDQPFAAEPLVAGANPLTFNVPCDALPGPSYMRFRFSSTGGLGFGGAATDGEIEDYAVLVKGFDYGDAPDPTYPTLLASDGARHVVLVTDNPTLGVLADIEPEGLQSPTHTGDDADGSDDEDGVTFVESVLIPGTDSQVELRTGTTGGTVSAWLDFNRDGDWADAGEQIVTDLVLGAGATTLEAFTVPVGSPQGSSCARIRISSTSGLAPTGMALDGEVEDYSVALGVEDPRIGVAKEVREVVRETPLVFLVTFDLRLENLGNVPLSEVNAFVDLATAFAAAAGFEVVSVASAELMVNPIFDGDASVELLAAGQSLGVGEAGMIELVVRIDTGGVHQYECSTLGRGTSPADMPVEDLSQDGDTSDPDNDGDPTDNDDPTVLVFNISVLPIPTLGEWGLILMAMLLSLAGLRRLRRS